MNYNEFYSKLQLLRPGEVGDSQVRNPLDSLWDYLYFMEWFLKNLIYFNPTHYLGEHYTQLHARYFYKTHYYYNFF